MDASVVKALSLACVPKGEEDVPDVPECGSKGETGRSLKGEGEGRWQIAPPAKASANIGVPRPTPLALARTRRGVIPPPLWLFKVRHKSARNKQYAGHMHAAL